VYVCANVGTHDSNVHTAMESAARANMAMKSYWKSQLNAKRELR
jgi:hypothetical protein